MKIFYSTPEFALSPLTCCYNEGHCVDTWGQSFRLSYVQLSKLKQFNRPTAAFTGTATDQTNNRIVENLRLVPPNILQSTCNRSNLQYKVIPKNEQHSKEDIVNYVQENFGNSCGIVYCFY